MTASTRPAGTALLAALLAAGLLLTGCQSPSTSTGGAAPTVTVSASSTSGQSASAPVTSATASDAAVACPTSNTTPFAKTKFVLHAGLAFGAFHRYLYKPFRAGTFRSGARGRLTAFIKAGLAALFIKREVRLASEDAKANPTLCRDIAAPLRSIGDSVGGAVDKLKGGDPTALENANTSINGVENSSKNRGAAITENQNPPIG